MTRDKTVHLSSKKSLQMHGVFRGISFYAGLGDSREKEFDEEQRPVRVLLADDQPSVRSALRLLLDQQQETSVVGEVTTTQELLKCVTDIYPDLLLLDWELPGLPARELLPTLHTLCPCLFIIVLNSRPQTRQAALEAGANEFVSKGDPPEQLLTAILNCQQRNHLDKRDE